MKWKNILTNNGKIIITDPNATRFFLTKQETVKLIERCLQEASSPQPFYLNMKSIEIGELLKLMINKYASKTPEVIQIGLQDGENMHELVASDFSSYDAERWLPQDLLKII